MMDIGTPYHRTLGKETILRHLRVIKVRASVWQRQHTIRPVETTGKGQQVGRFLTCIRPSNLERRPLNERHLHRKSDENRWYASHVIGRPFSHIINLCLTLEIGWTRARMNQHSSSPDQWDLRNARSPRHSTVIDNMSFVDSR